MTAYLSIMADVTADQHLIRVINLSPRGLGPKRIAVLKRAAEVNQVPLLAVVRNASYYVSDRAIQRAADSFACLYERLVHGMARTPVQELVNRAFEMTGYSDLLDKEDPEEVRIGQRRRADEHGGGI